MSQLSRTGLIGARTDALDEAGGELGPSALDLLDRLWRIFTSMRTALLLMLALAVLGLIGTVLIQAPAGIQSDEAAYAAWLDALRPKYGGWVPIIDRLGLFAVFQSIWFKTVLVGLTTSILSCSVNRFRGLWKTAIHPRTRMGDAFYERAPHGSTIESTVESDDAVGLVRGVFGSRHYRTVVEAEGGTLHVYADRFRWAPFGTLMAHISLVLILVGALIGSLFGFRNNELAVTVGTRVDVGGGTGLTLMARSFSDSYYENGAPSDYASDLVLFRDGVQVANQTIRVNEPLSYDGVAFYQSFFGPSAILRVADATGTVVYEGGVPLLWASDDGSRRVGQLLLADAGLTVYVVGAASGRVDPTIKAGQMQVEVYRRASEEPFAVEVLSQGQPATIGDLRFTFEREQQFTGLIVARDPGVAFVWLGALLLVGGLFLVFMFPNRRIWTSIRREAGRTVVRIGATARNDATFGPDFQKVVADMRQALGQAAD